MSSSVLSHTLALTKSAVRTKIHKLKDSKIYNFHKFTFCSYSQHLYDQPLTYPPHVTHFCSAARSQDCAQVPSWNLSARPPLIKTTHQCQNISHSFLFSPVLSPSSHLDVSLALLLSELVCGVYTLPGLRTLVTASLHVCMSACAWLGVS